jgi:tRNA pseudouridine65 synthase
MSETRAIEFLFADEHLVVVNKPSGLLVHRGWDNDDDVALFRVRDALGARVDPVHRLDRGTSGALVFSRSKACTPKLAQAFEHGVVEKTYLALVRGHMREDMARIAYDIPRTEDGPRVPAVTHVCTLGRSEADRCSLVEAKPETGRLHQIRRHLRHLSHPLIGDVRHGDGRINRHYRAIWNLSRLALHAERIAFDHPMTGVRLNLHAPMPADLRAPLEALGFAAVLELRLSGAPRGAIT